MKALKETEALFYMGFSMSGKKRASARIQYRLSRESAAKSTRLEEIRARNKAKIESLADTYIVCNKYSGKTISHICFAPKTLMLIIIIIPILIMSNLTIFNVFIGSLIEIAFIILIFVNRIKVSPQGIKYHNWFLK